MIMQDEQDTLFERKVREMEHQYMRLRNARMNRKQAEWIEKDAEARVDELRREIFKLQNGAPVDEPAEQPIYNEFDDVVHDDGYSQHYDEH